MEINPRVVFERMFGEPGTRGAARRRADAARPQHPRLRHAGSRARCSAASGRAIASRLGEYLDNIREIERRIQRTEAHNRDRVLTPIDAPIGVPESFEEHVGLMYDLLAVAYQADLTRVFTFMIARELSAADLSADRRARAAPPVSHHGNDPEKIAKVVKINTYHSQLFAKFLEKLRATPDGDGIAARSLADLLRRRHGQSESARRRSAADGGRRRRRRAGATVTCRAAGADTPVGNLWLTVAQKFGSPIESFGESNGTRGVLSETARSVRLSSLREATADHCRLGECELPDPCARCSSVPASRSPCRCSARRLRRRWSTRSRPGDARPQSAAAAKPAGRLTYGRGSTARRRCTGRSAPTIVATVRLLLRAGAQANAANRYGVTPLSLAASTATRRSSTDAAESRRRPRQSTPGRRSDHPDDRGARRAPERVARCCSRRRRRQREGTRGSARPR